MAIYLEYMGYSVELPAGETIVGRDIGCTLRFNDPGISRRHVRLERHGDEVWLEDLGSTNGTSLNGKPLEGRRKLGERDRFELGNQALLLRITDDFAEQPSTRRLASLKDLSSLRQASNVGTARLTAGMMVVQRDRQRCPRCTAIVASTDRSCATCNYQWDGGRPRSPTISSVDRRRHMRAPVELRLVYSSAELEIEATTRDLSRTGVFVCTQVLDPLGTHCELTILVDGGPPLQVRGIVRRVIEHRGEDGDSEGLGIEFLGIDEDQQAWIDLTIARASMTEPIQLVDPA